MSLSIFREVFLFYQGCTKAEIKADPELKENMKARPPGVWIMRKPQPKKSLRVSRKSQRILTQTFSSTIFQEHAHSNLTPTIITILEQNHNTFKSNAKQQ